MSHRSLRSLLVPFTTGLAAVIAVFAVAGSVPAFGVGSGTGAADDAVRAQEWWLAGLNATRAWPQTRGAGVTVAVLGTGVAAGHPDLAGDVLTGPDYTGSGRTPGGPFWGIDGTQVAAIVAGHGHGTGRQSGIVGVAPAAKILSVRVDLEFNDPLNADQAITRRLPGAIADGITYAVNHGARVIDLPLDPGTFGLTGHGDPAAAGGSPAEQAAVSYALRKSVVLVAPAGDDGEGPGLVNYPAAYTGVITVGAVSRNGRLAPFSSKHSYVALTAPGVGLIAATPPASYATISSTSTASGIVAGVAALLLSRFPHLTVAQVTQALTKSTATSAVTDGAAGPGTGYGTLDAARAVTLAADISTATRPARAATPRPAKPRKPPRRVNAAPPRANASALAGSLVRDIVAALGVLIVLVVVLLLIVNSRRKRVLAGSVPKTPGSPDRPRGPREPRGPRGQHGHRRPDQAPGPAQETARPIRPQLATPAVSAVPAASWPAPGGWQGGSVGEIAHPPAAPLRPAIAPVPRTGPPGRGGAGPPAGPPWAPAPEPERTFGPLPVTSANSFTPGPGGGIRVPRDMTAPPATMAAPGPFAFDPVAFDPVVFDPVAFDPVAFDPVAFDPAERQAAPGFSARPPAFDFTAVPSAPASPPPAPVSPLPAPVSPPPTPAFPPAATDADTPGPATMPDLGAATIPGFPRLDTGQDDADLDVTRPITLPDLPSRRSLGFAAAPVAIGYPAPDIPVDDPAPDAPADDPAPDVPAGYGQAAGPADDATPAGSGAEGGSSYIWDPAATDVFPVVPPEPPTVPDDDAPGASES